MTGPTAGAGEPSRPATGWRLRRASLAPGLVGELGLVGDRLVDPATLAAAAPVIDLEDRPVLAGLVDQHVHLSALAAAWTSVDVSPDALRRAGGLVAALRQGRADRPKGWLRAVGYDVATSGALDRAGLDAAGVGPVRVQDRTGTTWTLDSLGLASVLPADRDTWPAGVELDASGRPTGRLVRLDAWLRARLDDADRSDRDHPDHGPEHDRDDQRDRGEGPEPTGLGVLGTWLARRGVTSVVDASATNDTAALTRLASAGLAQRIVAMTGHPDTAPVEGVEVGAVKVLLDDADLPPLDELSGRVAAAHRHGRRVAVHCVTTVQLVLALAAGLGPGDRIEHGSVIPDQVVPLVAEAGVVVVTQPGLVRTRGDRYLAEVEEHERAALYRLASLRRAGIPVAVGTDAPYGPADPWVHVAAAVDRRTRAGVEVGGDEAVDFATAVGLLQRDPLEPDHPRRRLVPGVPGDLCVLDTDWAAAVADPSAVRVHATWIGGRPVHGPHVDADGPDL